MRPARKIIALASLVLCLSVPRPAAAYFKNLGYGAQGMAMGGAFTAAADDATSIIWNPASLATLAYPELYYMYTPMYNGKIRTNFLAATYPLSRGKTVALGAIFKDDAEFRFRETTLMQGFSIKVLKRLYAGAVIHELLIEGYDGGGGSGFDFSIGFLYNARPNLAFGLNWENLGQKVDVDLNNIGPNESAQTVATVGVLYRVTPKMDMAMDFRGGDTLNFGVRMNPSRDTTVRFGVNDRMATVGMGWTTSGWNLSHAFRFDSDQGDPQRFSVSYRWGKDREKNRDEAVAAGEAPPEFIEQRRGANYPAPGPPRQVRPVPGALQSGFRAYSKPGRILLPDDELGFSDLQGCWAKSDIMALSQYGVFEGYTDGTFKPDRMISAAEFERLVKRLKKLMFINATDLEIHYFTPGISIMEIVIFDDHDQRVRRLRPRQRTPGGEGVIYWNGIADSGEHVKPGNYTYVIEVEPAGGGDKVTLTGRIEALKASDAFAVISIDEEKPEYVSQTGRQQGLNLAMANQILLQELDNFKEIRPSDPSLMQRPITRGETAAILNEYLKLSREKALAYYETALNENRPEPFDDKNIALGTLIRLQEAGVDGYVRQSTDKTRLGWLIQVGSFAEKRNAERMATRLSDMGFHAAIESPRAGSNENKFKVVVSR